MKSLCHITYLINVFPLEYFICARHNSCFRNPTAYSICKILNTHFSKDSSYTVNIVEKLERTGRRDMNTMDFAAKPFRKVRET